MNEYLKRNAQKGIRQNTTPVQDKTTNGIPNSAMQDVLSGRAHATSQMMGHSQNLAPSIAAKMSRSFGMDLTGMQVYRSDAMVGSGMEGMASGNKVVLSSDVDLNTTAGQAVLGHEISHIRAQSQGIGMGNSGLYENAALEHQADTEGLMAAQGKSIYSDGAMDMGGGMQYGLGMQGVEGLTALGGGMSASAGAPMQAKKGGKKPTAAAAEQPAATETEEKTKKESSPFVEEETGEIADAFSSIADSGEPVMGEANGDPEAMKAELDNYYDASKSQAKKVGALGQVPIIEGLYNSVLELLAKQGGMLSKDQMSAYTQKMQELATSEGNAERNEYYLVKAKWEDKNAKDKEKEEQAARLERAKAAGLNEHELKEFASTQINSEDMIRMGAIQKEARKESEGKFAARKDYQKMLKQDKKDKKKSTKAEEKTEDQRLESMIKAKKNEMKVYKKDEKNKGKLFDKETKQEEKTEKRAKKEADKQFRESVKAGTIRNTLSGKLNQQFERVSKMSMAASGLGVQKDAKEGNIADNELEVIGEENEDEIENENENTVEMSDLTRQQQDYLEEELPADITNIKFSVVKSKAERKALKPVDEDEIDRINDHMDKDYDADLLDNNPELTEKDAEGLNLNTATLMALRERDQLNLQNKLTRKEGTEGDKQRLQTLEEDKAVRRLCAKSVAKQLKKVRAAQGGKLTEDQINDYKSSLDKIQKTNFEVDLQGDVENQVGRGTDVYKYYVTKFRQEELDKKNAIQEKQKYTEKQMGKSGMTHEQRKNFLAGGDATSLMAAENARKKQSKKADKEMNRGKNAAYINTNVNAMEGDIAELQRMLKEQRKARKKK